MNNLEIDSKYKKWLNVVCKDGDLHPSINFMCQKHKRLIDKIPVGFRDIFSFKTISTFQYHDVDTFFYIYNKLHHLVFLSENHPMYVMLEY